MMTQFIKHFSKHTYTQYAMALHTFTSERSPLGLIFSCAEVKKKIHKLAFCCLYFPPAETALPKVSFTHMAQYLKLQMFFSIVHHSNHRPLLWTRK